LIVVLFQLKFVHWINFSSNAMFTLPRNERSTILECLYACQISHALNFLFRLNVLNQSHLLLSKNGLHQLLPSIFKCQT